jgi:uncharacterized protein YhbP (UPF0306 family)
MEKEYLAQMLANIEKIGDKQTEMLIKQAEMQSEQKHTATTIDRIEADVCMIKDIQFRHTDDIRDIMKTIADSNSTKQYIKDFFQNHPVLSIIIALTLVNMVLVSVGIPIIDIGAVWTAIK